MPVLIPLDLLRRACADHYDALGAHSTANRFRNGERDGHEHVDIARRAFELATEYAAQEAIGEALEHEAIYAGRVEQGDDGNPDAFERSQDRTAARARVARRIADRIAGRETIEPQVAQNPDGSVMERRVETDNYPRNETPLPMVLHCPDCGTQHIDAEDKAANWTNPPHRSHKCLNPACGTIWRPANIATTGVASIVTRGKSDTWPSC